jgi:hypothetical protein
VDDLIVFPAYQLMVVEERLGEQEAEGVRMPEGMERDELALQVLIAAAMESRQTEPKPRRNDQTAAPISTSAARTVSTTVHAFRLLGRHCFALSCLVPHAGQV